MQMRFEQVQKQTQKLIMSPQMQQAMHLLQLPLMELNAVIEQEMVANPVLEEVQESQETAEEEAAQEDATEADPELDFDKEFDILARLDDEWREYFQATGSFHRTSDEEEKRRRFFEASITMPETLEEHLVKQLHLSSSLPRTKEIGELIIGNIDEAGFLTASREEICASCGCSPDEFEQTLRLVQSFHPVGVGARTLQECLLLQLDRLGKGTGLEARIVANHMEELGHRNFPAIASRLSVDVKDVQRAAEMIATLEPRPGRIFDQEEPYYIIPDVLVEKVGEDYVVTFNSEYTPRLRINNLYKKLMKEKALESSTKSYIREKIQAGRWLVRNIQQRQQTLYNIATELVRRQRSFLDNGISHLRPLTMQTVATALGIHESTVSRAIANKYIDTPQGLFQMKYFFSTGLSTDSGGAVSTKNVKEVIHTLIKNEDPANPLTDQKIIELLTQQGIQIARRTVAKYRKELHILPSNLRKKF